MLLGHRGAPEVVTEKSGKVGRRPEVFVVLDGADIIEHEVTEVGVAVDDEDQGRDEGQESPSPEMFWIHVLLIDGTFEAVLTVACIFKVLH